MYSYLDDRYRTNTLLPQYFQSSLSFNHYLNFVSVSMHVLVKKHALSPPPTSTGLTSNVTVKRTASWIAKDGIAGNDTAQEKALL